MGVTIKDIARLAGVSYSTVSKALHDSPLVKEQTKNKIISIAREQGYLPNIAAQRLVSRKSRAIGVHWPSLERVALSNLISKINDELEQRGYSMLLSVNPRQSAMMLFERFQVDGILVFSEENESVLDETAVSVPILYYGSRVNSQSAFLQVDRQRAIAKAVQYFVQIGHERITYIGDMSDTHRNQKEKLIGFKQAIAEAGISLSASSMVDTKGLGSLEGYQAVKKLLQFEQLPTAIISGSYDLTTGVIRALHEARISIPNQISLISYDNIAQMAEFDVPVTAVGPSSQHIARSLVDAMLELLNHGALSSQSDIKLDGEIVVRESTATLSDAHLR